MKWSILPDVFVKYFYWSLQTIQITTNFIHTILRNRNNHNKIIPIIDFEYTDMCVFQLAIMSVKQSRWEMILPDVEIREECFLLRLISTSDVIAFALIRDQLPVRLDHDRVEVLDPIRLKRSKSD